MSYSLEHKLVVAVSSRALFDLAAEHEIFQRDGAGAYREYQLAHEREILLPGAGFMLVKALLALNDRPGHERNVEVIVMSRNSADTSLRIFHSIQCYGLGITRAVLVSGASLIPYLKAFGTALFLSAEEQDVQEAVNAGIAAGIICERCGGYFGGGSDRAAQIRIAFDGDAVLFSDAAERIYQEAGLEVFEQSEARNAFTPLPRGPFAGFLRALSDMQREFQAETSAEDMPIRTALVTARCAPAHERVIRTLRAWGVRIDETFFLGGISKKEILRAFGAQIFFDDQELHTKPASEVVPSARVPYRCPVIK